MFNIEKVTDYFYKIKTNTVDIEIYANKTILKKIEEDDTLKQALDITKLPGIKKVLLMSDAHQGYGFPIGSVAAFDYEEGIISPGGVGYDINCGVRAISLNVDVEEVQKNAERILYGLYAQIPKGAVSDKAIYYLNEKKLRQVTFEGAEFAIKNGFGEKLDLQAIEDNGRIEINNDCLTNDAVERGKTELGSLGSGNHFLEIDKVEEIFDKKIASAFGIYQNYPILLLHTGSRGLGHQIAIDYLRLFKESANQKKLSFPNKELTSLPFSDKLAKDYFEAANQAANYAFANRQILGFKALQIIFEILKKPINYTLIYDIVHNIAKIEQHNINGKNQKLIIHRKGATRAFYAKHSALKNSRYFDTGHPILIPGTMGSNSYILVANESDQTLNSICHGAGRVLGRRQAIKTLKNQDLIAQLKQKGILLLGESKKGLIEEAPLAYKDIDVVIDITVKANIAKKVAKLKPLLVIKG
ncbi:MAG: RtcB family protein [Desulfurella sp.]|uniref:RtcB family protein n=1 Tax=Desulfurella sp. TaxID=1962857 RepID=UPI003D1226B7